MAEPSAANRSAPSGPLTPVLVYADVRQAVAWLCEVLGFRERVRIGPGHRAQLSYGEGSLIVADAAGERVIPDPAVVSQETMLRVVGLDAVCRRAEENGARVLEPPEDFPYGERQCSLVDPGGHHWRLTETVRDVAPEEWGGEAID